MPAAIVPLAPALNGIEVEDVVERMDAAFLLFDPAHLGGAAGEDVALPACAGLRLRIRRRATTGAVPAAFAALNPAFVRFSSGTTGTSKGVLLSHETILARTDAADAGLRITSDDTVLWVLSMSYHFVVSILLFLRRGATIVICPTPFLGPMREGLATHRATVTYASPFHYQLAAASHDFAADAFANVRLAISTAMALPGATAQRFAERFRTDLCGAYGIIEVGLPFMDGIDGRRRAGSVGRALPAYEVRIDAPDADGGGEILLRGPGMFDAYVSPWRLREDALDDGWFRTGDVGHVDADGFLFISGRTKSVINFAGLKVFPTEVEETLDAHPDVRESLVHGADHATYGQLPAARVVPRDGVDERALERDLRAWCRARLAPFKVPATFEFVRSLPRTASNKLSRRS